MPHDFQTFLAVINIVQAIGISAALGVWLRYKLQNRKLSIDENDDKAQRRRDDFQLAMDVVTKQRDDALGAIHDCHDRIEKMEMEVQGLRLARDLDPFPSWVFSLEGHYLYVNREFEKEFLESTGQGYRDIVGRTHEHIWPQEFCRTLRNLDDLARRVPGGRARATANLTIGGDERQVTVQKFPIRIRGAVVAFAGFITDIQSLDEVLL